jgi:hypothetical protein
MCQEWVRRHCTPTKGFCRTRSSYGLKHAVERWTATLGETFKQIDMHGRGPWESPYFYVTNGAFITAMQREGYRVARAAPGDINAVFNARYSKHPRATATTRETLPDDPDEGF